MGELEETLRTPPPTSRGGVTPRSTAEISDTSESESASSRASSRTRQILDVVKRKLLPRRTAVQAATEISLEDITDDDAPRSSRKSPESTPSPPERRESKTSTTSATSPRREIFSQFLPPKGVLTVSDLRKANEERLVNEITHTKKKPDRSSSKSSSSRDPLPSE